MLIFCLFTTFCLWMYNEALNVCRMIVSIGFPMETISLTSLKSQKNPKKDKKKPFPTVEDTTLVHFTMPLVPVITTECIFHGTN